MKPINLDRINAIVPYKVETDGKQFSFVTRHGLHYEIRFFEEQPIGGLGIMIVKKIMDECAYDRINGKNILVLKKRFK